MKYSFIIPTYNNGDLLLNTLLALNNQIGSHDNDFEVIIIDDGSKIPINERIEGLSNNYDLIYHYINRTKDSSRSKARNVGLKFAKGKFIIFIDADIIVPPNYLNELDRITNYNEIKAIIGTRYMLNSPVSNESVLDGSLFDSYKEKYNNINDLDFRQSIFNSISYNASTFQSPFMYALTCNLMIPRKYIDMVGGFDEELIYWGIEDIEFAFRMYKKGLRFIINSNMEVLHQYHCTYGDYVSKDKMDGLNKNIEIFISKHKHEFNINDQEIYNLFESIATRYSLMEEKKNYLYTIKLELKDSSQICIIKNIITLLQNLEDVEIIITDYLENTDFDIWIQCLDLLKVKIAYFPFSKILR